MYEQYNRLQREQLQCQQYEATQKTRILIYAPDRCPLLHSSLSCQLHTNYSIYTRIESIMGEEYDGVLIIGEDAELMSVALMHYAKAIRAGADIAFSDALFGPNGETQCLWPKCFTGKGSNIVVVSKKIFNQLGSEMKNAHSLIAAAMEKSLRVTHIPLALVSHRRTFRSTDAFSSNKKQALVLCHEMSMSGAPIVLTSAMSVLKSQGFEVAVLGPEYGEAVSLFLEAEVPVIINSNQLKDESLYGMALCSDFVLANTVVEAESINLLSGSSVNVLWWLHDAYLCYPMLGGMLPQKQEDNVKICAVGKHASAAMHSVRPDFKIEQLLYGLPDYTEVDVKYYDFGYEQGKILMACVGSIEKRKGQDILVEAISMLTTDELKKVYFLFVGRVLEQEVFESVMELANKYPKNVAYIERLTREEILSLMKQCTCAICSSIDDPMPTFVTEAAMFGKPAIVSEHTGTAGIITHGKDGFVYYNDDPEELCERIREVIQNPGKLSGMQDDCRALYVENFTKEVFADKLGMYIKGF